MNITWDAEAAQAFAELVEEMSLNSNAAAERFVAAVSAAMDRLDLFPELGRVIPELGHTQLRELFVGRYRLLYRLHADGIEVATLWPSAVPLEGTI